MSVTIYDIAKELGVVPSTVSRALNDRSGVDHKLKAAIIKTAERMGYTPYTATYDSKHLTSKTKTIAVIFPRLNQHFMVEIQKGIDRILYKKKYSKLNYTIDFGSYLINEEVKQELIFKRLLNDQNISGIIFAFLYINDVLLARFHKNNIATVLLNNYTDYSKCIIINNFNAMYKITNMLIKTGHKKIGLIMPSEETEQVWRDRYKGYKKCLKDHNIEYDPNLIMHEWTFQLKETAYTTKTLIKECPEITAIIFGNDTQAYAGIKALHNMNIKVPEDIAVVGFDDMEFNHIIKPSLSSIHQPIKEMAEKGIEMLINSIEKKDYSHEMITLESSIELRGSCIKNYKDTYWEQKIKRQYK